MRQIALALIVVAACKSSEKSSTSPEPSAAPVPDEKNAEAEPVAPAVAPPASEEPSNALVVGTPVRKEWKDGGPGEVVWKVAGGGHVTLTAKAGEPEGVLMAEFKGKQQHVTNFSCDLVRAGSEAAFALTPEGKVIFRAAVGPAGKRPGLANVFLLEWKPDKETVFVANGWQGLATAEPPPWAKI
jgi:hypothetical protein